jgi:threonine/homoserine/homoserine lactone efflux protein
MNAALPIIVAVVGILGVACLGWVLFAALRSRTPLAQPRPPKRPYTPPSNDEDVERMVAALSRTTRRTDRRNNGPSRVED